MNIENALKKLDELSENRKMQVINYPNLRQILEAGREEDSLDKRITYLEQYNHAVTEEQIKVVQDRLSALEERARKLEEFASKFWNDPGAFENWVRNEINHIKALEERMNEMVTCDAHRELDIFSIKKKLGLLPPAQPEPKDEMIIQDEIIRIARISMNKFMKDFSAVSCEHEWADYAGTYKCSKCEFYVGTNSLLQDAIRNALKEKERK